MGTELRGSISLVGIDRRGREIHAHALGGHQDTAEKRGAGIVRPIPEHFRPKKVIESGSFSPAELPLHDSTEQ